MGKEDLIYVKLFKEENRRSCHNDRVLINTCICNPPHMVGYDVLNKYYSGDLMGLLFFLITNEMSSCTLVVV